MRIVVSGATGFVGSHVVAKLRNAGRDVVAVARTAAPGVEVVTDYRDAPEGDVLIHLAQDSDRRRVNAAPAHELEAAAATVEQLAARFRRVVYASSAAIYDDAGSEPFRIDHPSAAADNYTRLKQGCEQVVLASDGVVARLSNVYGPGMSPSSVLANILAQAHQPGPLRVWNDQPVRDFLWAGDAAAGLIAMTEGGATGVYHLATGVGTSVGELALRTIDMLGQSGREVIATAPERQRSYLVLDIDETVRTWGWRPLTSLSEGLARLVRAGNRGI